MTTITIDATAFRALQRAAASKDVREYLNHIFIDTANKTAFASDGYIMVEAPIAVDGHTDTNYLVSVSVNVTAGWGIVTLDMDTNRATGTRANHLAIVTHHPSTYYPDTARISAHGPNWSPLASDAPAPDVMFNPALLARVTEKLLARIEFPSDKCKLSAFKVTVTDDLYRVTLMPCTRI